MEGNMKRVFSSERKSTYKFVSEKVPIFQANHEDDGSTLCQEGDLVGVIGKEYVGNIILINTGENTRQDKYHLFTSCRLLLSSARPSYPRTKSHPGDFLKCFVWKRRLDNDFVIDFAKRILSYFQDCGCEGFISSAIGSISRPTLNHGGSTVSYEGSYVILKVSSHYSFDSNGQVKQTGNLGISFADSKGVAFCGSVAGSLTAATPIQVMVTMFLNDDGKE